MLARIAQELFWLGRDFTRAEHTARMLDGVFHAELEGDVDDPFALRLSWSALLAVIGAQAPAPGSQPRGEIDPVPEHLGVSDPGTVVHLLTLDRHNPASVVSCVARGRERARSVRDVISTEMWEAVNTFHMGLERRARLEAIGAAPYSFYSEVKERSALFWGLVDRTMVRDEARAFLEAGGRLEAADMVLRMLRVALPADIVADPAAWIDGATSAGETRAIALLHAVGGAQAYHRAVRRPPNAGPVAHFLLFARDYPGSVASATEALGHALAAADPQSRTSPPALRIARLVADLEFQARAEGDGVAVTRIVGRVQDELASADAEIALRYFAGWAGAVTLLAP